MKNVILITLIVAIVSVLSCKKDRTSFWEVNNERFSTNQINLTSSPGGTGFSTKSRENGFGMVFIGAGGMPGNGSYNIGGNPNNHNNIDVIFYYHSKYYIPAQPGSTKMQASVNDRKSTLTIPPTWFKHLEYDSTFTVIAVDSVIIQATLNEP